MPCRTPVECSLGHPPNADPRPQCLLAPTHPPRCTDPNQSQCVGRCLPAVCHSAENERFNGVMKSSGIRQRNRAQSSPVSTAPWWSVGVQSGHRTRAACPAGWAGSASTTVSCTANQSHPKFWPTPPSHSLSELADRRRCRRLPMMMWPPPYLQYQYRHPSPETSRRVWRVIKTGHLRN